ncbi:hypothetical protein DIPPA_05324 [Diplonema papillatum]|nr:hypothetical protein DIPPA_05324 [Diplonema papillatum]
MQQESAGDDELQRTGNSYEASAMQDFDGFGDEQLDPGMLEKLSALIPQDDLQRMFGSAVPLENPPSRQSAAGDSPFTAGTQGFDSQPHATPTSQTAEEAEILQSKAESVVAALDDASSLKQQNPFAGYSFEDLIKRISLNQDVRVYRRQVAGEKLIQGTVAEQLLAVIDCENERHMHRLRTVQDDYEKRLATLKAEQAAELDHNRNQLLRERLDIEHMYGEQLDQSKQTLQQQTEELAKASLQCQLESERTKDELGLVSEDVASLKKLLFFWKKKNNALKQQYDVNERELLLAREKLKDYHHLHEMDAYKVHRFCGQLREKEMQARWKAEEATRKLHEHQHNQRQGGDKAPFSSPRADGFETDLSLPPQLDGRNQSQLHTVDPTDSSAWDRMRDDVNKSRFALSNRCKTILGMAAVFSEGLHSAGLTGREYLTAGPASEQQALSDGIRLRDDQIDVLMSALRYRDKTVEDLRAELQLKTGHLLALQAKAWEPLQAEDLVEENAALQMQLGDAKEIIYSMQRQMQEERQQIAEERKARADREVSEAKARRETELQAGDRLREKETEIIRLRNRLRSNAGAGGEGDAAGEMRAVRLEQANTELEEQITLLEEERTRLKQYVASLGSRLEQSLSQLEYRNQKLRQYETLAQSLTLSPRHANDKSNLTAPGLSPIRPVKSRSPAMAASPIPTPQVMGRLF